MTQAIADELLERHELTLDRESVAYTDLCAALARARLAALGDIDAGVSGLELPPNLLPPAPLEPLPRIETVAPKQATPPASIAAADLSPEGERPLSALVDEIITRRGLEGKYAEDYRIAVRWFEEEFGPKTVTKVTKRDAIAFKKLLEATPVNAGQRFPKATLREASALNKRRAQPFPTMTGKTVTKWLSPLRVIFGMLADDLIVEANPFEGVRPQATKAEPRRKKRDPFTTDQLKAIFGSPLYVGARSEARLTEPGPVIVQDHRRWVPLAALFSGARPTELAQLEVSDLIERDGITMFSVNTAADEDDDESPHAPRKRVKTESGVRLIPVHKELVRLGFLDYVAQQRKAKAKRIFESWKPTATGDYIATFPRFFNRTLLPNVKAKTRRTSFYSFRHCFKDAQRRAHLHPGIADALFGHADTSVAGIYGSGAAAYSPRQLADAMNAISYDLDLGHLTAR